MDRQRPTKAGLRDEGAKCGEVESTTQDLLQSHRDEKCAEEKPEGRNLGDRATSDGRDQTAVIRQKERLSKEIPGDRQSGDDRQEVNRNQ